MPVLPKPDDKNFQPVPTGNHVAVCYRVIDLGTQRVEWQGKAKLQRKILISWELPDEKMEDGRPFTIGQRFTWSMSEKSSLRHVLESWRGKAFTEADFAADGFDIKNVIGVGCMLNVVHESKNGKTYSNIAAIARLPKGMTAPVPVNKRSYVWLSKEEFAPTSFDELSDYVKATIQQTPEYKALSEPERITDEPPASHPVNDFYSDEIPF